jgi:hypothetical protein
MKKVVIFTLAMVLALSSFAFALLNDNDKNAVALFGAQAATSGGENTFVSKPTEVQGNAIAGDQAATNGGVNVSVKDALNNDHFGADNRSNYNNDNRTGSNLDNTYNIVDNAVLANVNLATTLGTFAEQENTMSFRKTQESEIRGSFNDATGVSNVNSAAGNMNNQAAFTTIKIGSIGGK